MLLYPCRHHCHWINIFAQLLPMMFAVLGEKFSVRLDQSSPLHRSPSIFFLGWPGQSAPGKHPLRESNQWPRGFFLGRLNQSAPVKHPLRESSRWPLVEFFRLCHLFGKKRVQTFEVVQHTVFPCWNCGMMFPYLRIWVYWILYRKLDWTLRVDYNLHLVRPPPPPRLPGASREPTVARVFVYDVIHTACVVIVRHM